MIVIHNSHSIGYIILGQILTYLDKICDICMICVFNCEYICKLLTKIRLNKTSRYTY